MSRPSRRASTRRPAGRRRYSRGALVRRMLLLADVVGLIASFAVASVLLAPQLGSADKVGPLVRVRRIPARDPVLDPPPSTRGSLRSRRGARRPLHRRRHRRRLPRGHDRGLGVRASSESPRISCSRSSGVSGSSGLSPIVLIPTLRAGARLVCRHLPGFDQNAVIVGAGKVGQQLALKLLNHREYGINLVGFVDDRPTELDDELAERLPLLLGGPDRLREFVTEHEVDRVIIAFSNDSHESVLANIRAIRDLDVQIDIVPRYFEVFGAAAEVHTLEGVPLVGLRPMRLSRSSRILKRTFDLFAATLGLLFLAPLFAAVALCIKLGSRGPVFFRQVRRGSNGTTFRIYKFRTMVAEAEEQKAEVVHLNMHRDRDPRMTKIPDDPRVTRVGRFLRRSSIDELPQLINVIKGEMSLVGPRPLILEEDAFVQEWARKRLDLKPGITGLWQVLGRSDIPFDEMTKLDYVYVTNWSLREDIRLILLTVPSLLRPRRAF